MRDDPVTDKRLTATAISSFMAAVRQHTPGAALSIKPEHVIVSQFGEWLVEQGVTEQQLRDLWQDDKYAEAMANWQRKYRRATDSKRG